MIKMVVRKIEEKIEELVKEYDGLLEKLGKDMIEGVGLEGDWDVMSDKEKIDALVAAIGVCEDELQL